ncbi:MAG: Fe-S cluster assembly protein SufD [Planctomycetes bacterium]|nr:Fe-S cluster assembly protein SufD [Planctomycetota bacterium]
MGANTLAEPFIEDFARAESALRAPASPWLHPVRKAAVSRFRESGFPGRRDEEWLYTSVARVLGAGFRSTPAGAPPPAVAAGAVARARLLGAEAPLIVFVNGAFRRELSRLEALPDGVVLESLGAALAAGGGRLEPRFARRLLAEERLGAGAPPRADEAFAALNTALFEDGVLFETAPKRRAERPVEILYLTAGVAQPAAIHPRNLFVIGAESRATLVETYASIDAGAAHLTNALTEVWIEPGASFEHYKIAREGPAAAHVAAQRTRQGARSSYATWFVALGGRVVRNEITLSIEGEECESGLFGIYVATGERHVDNHTLIHHVAPRCHSREIYKGILADRATGVFSGKIHVHQDAQKTDAKQSNDNLLLSDGATANTRPRLEIYADDVRCTHGATVGQLDAAALFYLRSRGLSLAEARELLTRAFADELFLQIESLELRARLEGLVHASLPAAGAP